MSHENIIAILSILISAIITIAGINIAWQTEKLRAMREQLSEKKYNAYADATALERDFGFTPNGGSGTAQSSRVGLRL